MSQRCFKDVCSEFEQCSREVEKVFEIYLKMFKRYPEKFNICLKDVSNIFETCSEYNNTFKYM